MSSRSAHSHSSVDSLADAIYDALKRDDIPRTMHLSWLLMQQPYCPIHLQAQAVLVNSAASLTLGGDPDVIETNLQSMVKRLSSTLTKLPMQGAEAPWNVKALGQLRAAVVALRSSRYENKYRRYLAKPCLDLDSLVAGFGKMGLGGRRDDVIIREEHDGPWRSARA